MTIDYTGRPIIGYIRVSTSKQERSGLGLLAQQSAIESFVAMHNCTILTTYREIETGKKADRPKLRDAIAHARRCRAVLVVAKLDRLARNVPFTSALMASRCDFVCCDNPYANRLTLHILAAVAQDEAERISERTRAALAAARATGTLLGASRPECRKLTQEARVRGAKRAGDTAKRLADEAYSDVGPRMVELRQNGSTLQSIADTLNAEGNLTRFNKQWTATQVRNVVIRYSQSPA